MEQVQSDELPKADRQTPEVSAESSCRCRLESQLGDALNRVAKSSFCRGQNERGWKADIDWFLKPDTLTKILEGKYDDQGNRLGKPSATESNAIMTKHTAEVLARKLAEQEARQSAQKGGAS
jgi:hypothetical protein